MDEEAQVLDQRLGYHFRDRGVLERSLTHKSRAFESGGADADGRDSDNEQLEFLGDAILGFVISELLFRRYPSYPEGRLSKLKAYLVSAVHLYDVALRLELGSHLRLGRGEELSGGREKPALLANAVEALIAALFVDGGIDAAREFILQHVLGDFDPLRSEDNSLVIDYKSALQEMAQLLSLPAPRYGIVRETGPEHRKTFTVEARVGTRFARRAEGTSKKIAGQRAAHMVLEELSGDADDAQPPAAAQPVDARQDPVGDAPLP